MLMACHTTIWKLVCRQHVQADYYMCIAKMNLVHFLWQTGSIDIFIMELFPILLTWGGDKNLGVRGYFKSVLK